MEVELTSEVIISEFPDLFKDKNVYGLQCNKGWFPLIYEMCRELSQGVKEDSLDRLTIVQIKEKFGGLRVYIHHGNDRARAIYEKAARRAETTCELCGSEHAKMTERGGFYQTVCGPCYQREIQRTRS